MSTGAASGAGSPSSAATGSTWPGPGTSSGAAASQAGVPSGGPGQLHQRRQVDLLNRLSRRRGAGRGQAVLDLSPTTRRLDLPGGRAATFTDAVGFIAKLPHDLVEAFKSTLEEVARADLVVHLVDAAQPDPAGQMAAVEAVLGEVGAADVPELLVLNKATTCSTRSAGPG